MKRTTATPEKQSIIVMLSPSEYKQCFEIALKKTYASKVSHKTGLRAERGEVDMVNDFIGPVLAERGVKKFLKEKFGVKIPLDAEIAPNPMSQQKCECIEEKGKVRKVKIGVSIESNGWKSRYNILSPYEHEKNLRKQGVYIFVKVGLPSDHLFRILREHSFFKKVANELETSDMYKKIETLKEIPILITGYSPYNKAKKITEIEGRKFVGGPPHRYMIDVADTHNSDEDWKKLVKRL